MTSVGDPADRAALVGCVIERYPLLAQALLAVLALGAQQDVGEHRHRALAIGDGQLRHDHGDGELRSVTPFTST
jgi:hypothetical protein